MKKINLFYFARLKENLGISHETISIPLQIGSIAELISWQASRGEVWHEEFKIGNSLRAAINQTLVTETAKVESGDDIAFFPPVTGG